MANELRPHLVVLSLPLPDMSAPDIIRRLLSRSPPPYILVMSDTLDDQTVLAALRAGARSFLSKRAEPEELLVAARIAATGAGVFSSNISDRFLQLLQGIPPLLTAAFPSLTPRELEILRLIGEGYDNKRISKCLFLAEKTVRNHVSNVLAKLQATNRAAALIMARDAGLCG